jgi:hypothetical protein
LVETGEKAAKTAQIRSVALNMARGVMASALV